MHTYYTRLRRRQRLHTLGRVLGTMLMVAVFYTLVMFAFIEFMAGCGEVTYYGDGTWETNKCVFLDNDIERGTW